MDQEPKDADTNADDSQVTQEDAEAQQLIASWGDEVEAKGLTDVQWEHLVEHRSHDGD